MSTRPQKYRIVAEILLQDKADYERFAADVRAALDQFKDGLYPNGGVMLDSLQIEKASK